MPSLPPSPRIRRKTNRYAIVSFVTGVFGLSVVALYFGFAALSQLRVRRLERGKALAAVGVVTGGGWLVATVVFVASVLPSNAPGAQLGLSVTDSYPKPGQCFDTSVDGPQVRDCDRPHDAEMILIFELPEYGWPGQQEVIRLGDDECEQRLLARYRTRQPVENGGAYVLPPDAHAWGLGDRKIGCAIGAFGGGKLTAPIGPAPSNIRLLDELQPGDCFAKPRRDSATTTIMKCDAPHDAQATHRFDLPDGPYEGVAALKKKGEVGCDLRWNAMFAKNRSPVPIERWYVHPTEETWGDGDRMVLCYAMGVGGRDLNRSVVPG
jgi:hypothetical protein